MSRDYRVRDIMQRDVVTVRPFTTVRELVRALAERKISGAPVVGAGGEVIGIVSTTDLVRLAASAAETPLEEMLADLLPGGDPERAPGLVDFLAAEAWGEPIAGGRIGDTPVPRGREAPAASEEVTPEEVTYEEYTVSDIMQPAPLAVEPGDTLGALARVLLQGHVHRAPVVEAGRLVGIVTTFDLLRAIADENPPNG